MTSSAARGALLAAALVAAPLARAEHPISLGFSGDLGAGYDSNVFNAAPGWEEGLAFATAGAHGNLNRRLGDATSLLGRLSLTGETYEHVEGLTNGKAALMLRVSHRPGAGFFVPVLAGWVSAAWWEFDSRIRDSVEYRGGVYLLEQLTTALRARVSLTASQRVSESEAFDLEGIAAGVDLDWLAAPSLTVYTGYQFRDGDIASTSGLLYGYADVGEPDDAFAVPAAPAKLTHIPGGGSGTPYAYRFPATTHVGTLGVNLPIGSGLSLDVQAQYADSSTDANLDYERWIGSVSLLARF